MSHEDEDAACPECDGIDKHAAGCPWLDDVRTLHDGEHDDHIGHPHYGAVCMVEGNDWQAERALQRWQAGGPLVDPAQDV